MMKRKLKGEKVERRQVRDEPEVETDVHTWSVLPEALTGEHTHAPVESCKLASLFISLMWVGVSQLVCMCWHMCACLSSDVQGLCLRCLASYASLLSLCAFESVYAWISSASDPCAKCQISPQSPVRAPFIFTCLLSPYAMKPSPDITKLWQQWPNSTREQEGGSC